MTTFTPQGQQILCRKPELFERNYTNCKHCRYLLSPETDTVGSNSRGHKQTLKAGKHYCIGDTIHTICIEHACSTHNRKWSGITPIWCPILDEDARTKANCARDSEEYTKNEQLCWTCQNATNGGCEWSKRLKPVPGWEAKPTKIGYKIKNCPKYEKEERKKITSE